MEDLMNEMETTMDEIQYIVVKLGNEKYGIDISCVDNIVRMQHMTRVPKSQSYYVGVINLRGEVVPIMSLRRRFGLEDDVCQSATRIIIIRMQDQSLIGVIVDRSRIDIYHFLHFIDNYTNHYYPYAGSVIDWCNCR